METEFDNKTGEKFVGFYAKAGLFKAIKVVRNRLDLDTKSEVLRLAVVEFCEKVINDKKMVKKK